MITLFRPGFRNVETATDASKQFWKALEDEDIRKEKATDPMANEMRSVADKDTRAAYQILMATDLSPQSIMTKLTADQREQIRSFANGYLDAYKTGAKFDIKTFNPNPLKQPDNNTSVTSNTGKGVFATPPQPEGTKVRCAVCNGTGQYEKVTYSHTYNGIAADITTQITHWVICEFCNGTGWVMKYKKK